MRNPVADMQKFARKMVAFMHREAPHNIGKIAVTHTKESFEKSRYTEGSTGWEKRKKPNRKGKNDTKTLINTGRLKKSINYEVSADGETITLQTDEDTGVYGQVHNEGLKAGRGKGFTMPKRQFMPIQGEPIPPAMEKKMKAYVQTRVKQLHDECFN
jgi:phage gpG-like protein